MKRNVRSDMSQAPLIHREIFPNIWVGDQSPVHIMGIVNLSPESFYEESFIPDIQLKKKIEQFIQQRATMIDFGGRSTAPWSDPITLDQEKQRVQHALDILPGLLPNHMVISIDTQYAEIARFALDFAKQHHFHLMINDISSFQTDPSLKEVVITYNAPVIIMATENKPGDAKNPQQIKTALLKTITELREAGYDLNRLIIDPGVGKWIQEKTYQFDLAMLDQLPAFRSLECPILVGLSRKSFIGSVLGEKDPVRREFGSLSATAIAVYNGAHIIRTHDVDRAMVQTIKMARAIRGKSFSTITSEDDFISEDDPDYELKNFYRKEW